MALINTQAGKKDHVALHREDAPTHPDSRFTAGVCFRRALATPKSFPQALVAGANSSPFSPTRDFFHRKGAEQLRTARELEQGSCVHDSPTSTAFTHFPGSQWGPLPSHPSALSTNDRKWFNIHISVNVIHHINRLKSKNYHLNRCRKTFFCQKLFTKVTSMIKLIKWAWGNIPQHNKGHI